MGNLKTPANPFKETALGNGSRIVVIASQHHVDALSAAALSIPGLIVVPLEPGAPVSADLVRDAKLLVLEIDPANRRSMQRIGDIRQRNPDLPLVAAIEDASVSLVRTLVREGIGDVVALPFDLDELLQVSLDAVAKHDAAGQDAPLAPMVVMARSLGGCGTTSIATHLAADLAAHAPDGRGAAIADLDLQFGSVAHYLGVSAHGSLADLLGAKDRLDEELLRSVAGDAGNGLAVIAAPDTIMPLEAVDTDDLLRVLGLLRREYAHVVLDLPANWTNWTLSAALAADAIVLVVELTIPSLRQAKRRLELFRSVGIEQQAIRIVVNRVEKRLFRTINLTDVAETLNHPVLGGIALDTPTVTTAQNQGVLVGQIKRKSPFVTDIALIAEQLRAGLPVRGR